MLIIAKINRNICFIFLNFTPSKNKPKHFSSDIKFSKREKLVRCMCRQQAIKAGKALGQKEMQQLIHDLLHCETPNYTINGSPTFLEFKEDYLDHMFGKN